MRKSNLVQYKDKILEILRSRDASKTMCPSEVLDERDKKNTEKMEQVREAARELVAKGEIEITQRGKVVDPDNIRGPIRLRLKR